MATKYDELIKNLRGMAKGFCPFDIGNKMCGYFVTQEAADTIEELQKDLERSKDFEAFWQHEAEEALKKFQVAISNKQRWIPVTERLPLLNTPVLATDGIEVDISWMYGVPPRWITSYTAIDEDKLTHWMPLPKTPQTPEEDIPIEYFESGGK